MRLTVLVCEPLLGIQGLTIICHVEGMTIFEVLQPEVVKRAGKPIFSDVRESRNKEKENRKFLRTISAPSGDGEGEYEVDDDDDKN